MTEDLLSSCRQSNVKCVCEELELWPNVEEIESKILTPLEAILVVETEALEDQVASEEMGKAR